MSARGHRRRKNRPRTRPGAKPKLFLVGNPDGMYNYVVVAKSQKIAARKLGMSVYTLNQFGGRVDLDRTQHDYAFALAEPGVVFRQPCSYVGATPPPWEKDPNQVYREDKS
jgi:hypothetical protein